MQVYYQINPCMIFNLIYVFFFFFHPILHLIYFLIRIVKFFWLQVPGYWCFCEQTPLSYFVRGQITLASHAGTG